MKCSIEVALGNDVEAGVLKKFLERVPDTAKITAEITIIPKDRPFDSEVRYATLKAEWTES